MPRFSFVLSFVLFLGACGTGASNPSGEQKTYGAALEVTDAIPSVAVAAEAEMYEGRAHTVDGRIVSVREGGCALQLATEEGPPLLVVATGTGTDDCSWQVPAGTDGIAAATGTLHVEGDTLRLPANGVQVTPVQRTDSDM